MEGGSSARYRWSFEIVEPQGWMASSAALRRSHSRCKVRVGWIWLTKG
jgi:hypothetical protein